VADDSDGGALGDLRLRCTACNFPKVIRDYPVLGTPPYGMILTDENISIFKSGCVRCGTCRFRRESEPTAKPKREPPPGWVRRT
jgi:hypothetical protein